MRKMMAIVVALVVSVLAGCASAGFKGSATTVVHSRSINALGYQLSADPVMQGTLAGSYGSWEAKVIGFEGMSQEDMAADEVDLILGYKGAWWSAGAAYFALDPVLDHDGDVVMPFLEVRADLWEVEDQVLTGSMRLEDRIGKFPEHDHRFGPSISLQHSWKLAPDVLLANQASSLFDRGVDGFTRGWLFQYRLGLAVNLSKAVTAEGYVRVVRPYGFRDKLREYEHDEVVGASLTIKF